MSEEIPFPSLTKAPDSQKASARSFVRVTVEKVNTDGSTDKYGVVEQIPVSAQGKATLASTLLYTVSQTLGKVMA